MRQDVQRTWFDRIKGDAMKYLAILALLFLVACDEPPIGTVKCIYEEDGFKIFTVSKGKGNGYAYITNQGDVWEKTGKRSHYNPPPVIRIR